MRPMSAASSPGMPALAGDSSVCNGLVSTRRSGGIRETYDRSHRQNMLCMGGKRVYQDILNGTFPP